MFLPIISGLSKKPTRSPVPHLLQSNDPPSTEEAALVTGAISEANATIAELGRESRSRWKIWNRPRTQKADAFVLKHTVVLSPLRRMPVELLQEILSYLSPSLHESQDSLPFAQLLQARDLPWAVSQVCQSWRRSALSLPTLWTHLPAIATKSGEAARREDAYLRELLLRTKNAPLSVHLTLSLGGFQGNRAIRLLVGHCERWQALSIQCNGVQALLPFESIKHRMQSLRALSLTTYMYGGESIRFLAFEHAPQLRHIALDMHRLLDIELPFSRLVSYKDGAVLPTDIRKQLRNAPLLEVLDIWLSFQPGPLHSPVFILPRLRTLRVMDHCRRPYRCPSFIDNLIAPVLEHLEVQEDALFNVITMLSRTKYTCQLRTLVVTQAWNTAEQAVNLRTLFRLAPTLVAFSIEYVSVEAIDSLCAEGRGPLLLPNLRTAQFHLALGRDGLPMFLLVKDTLERWLGPAVDLNLIH